MTVRRSRRKQTISFDQRLRQAAMAARKQAGDLPAGEEREILLKKAQQAETAVQINDWLTAPSLRPAQQG